MLGQFLLPLSDPAATDADRVGPKAANLAALAQAGLPTPGGFCLTAEAYRRQIANLGLADVPRDYADADPPLQRRLAVEVRLKLYQGGVAPELLAEILAAWRDQPKPLAVRACWAALWTTNARRSMAQHGFDPADTAMAVLIQPLIAAQASGGGLSATADGHMLISATWGLGSAIAQGEVVPDRIV